MFVVVFEHKVSEVGVAACFGPGSGFVVCFGGIACGGEFELPAERIEVRVPERPPSPRVPSKEPVSSRAASSSVASSMQRALLVVEFHAGRGQVEQWLVTQL